MSATDHDLMEAMISTADVDVSLMEGAHYDDEIAESRAELSREESFSLEASKAGETRTVRNLPSIAWIFRTGWQRS